MYSLIEVKGLGQIINAPIDLQLSDHDIVQPDLVLVLKQRQAIITPTRLHGTPDLVVEILSESTANRDRHLKKALYCRSHVPEYWIVDLRRQLVEPWLLRGSEYQLQGEHREQIELTVLPGACVNLTEVW